MLLVLAESRVEGRSLFAGVPSLGENKPKNVMQLAGRCLLVFMFITLIRFELSFLQVGQSTALDIVVNVFLETRLCNSLNFVDRTRYCWINFDDFGDHWI